MRRCKCPKIVLSYLKSCSFRSQSHLETLYDPCPARLSAGVAPGLTRIDCVIASSSPSQFFSAPPVSSTTRKKSPRETMTLLQTLSSMGSDGTVPLTPREAASGLLGSVSMTCWIFLLVCLSPVSSVCYERFSRLKLQRAFPRRRRKTPAKRKYLTSFEYRSPSLSRTTATATPRQSLFSSSSSGSSVT